MNAEENKIAEIVRRFNDALNLADVDTMMSFLTEDTVFENTDPAPDGSRYKGQSQVRAFWENFFQSSSSAKIEIEEIFALGDRCVMRWVYRWQDARGVEGHIRGVDVYHLRNGLIHEKLSYVKG